MSCEKVRMSEEEMKKVDKFKYVEVVMISVDWITE